MASIQQAMNQMLATAGVAAGLYAHSPEGQRKAQIKQTEAAYNKVNDIYDTWAGPLDAAETEIYEKIQQTQLERSKKLYELDPSEERFKNWKADIEGTSSYHDFDAPTSSPKAKAEARAMASLKEKQDTRTQLEKEIKERRGEYMKEVAKSRAAAAAEINKFSGGKK